MKRIIDVFRMEGNKRTYEYAIDRLVPTIEDVMQKLSYNDAIASIELMLCSENYIREHLRIGSTPPTKIKVWKTPEEHKRLQTLIYEHFGETFICM
jgi:hypothetical protein